MNDILSKETADALEDAGFTQPKFEYGQLWYNDKNQLCMVNTDAETLAYENTNQFVYAPTSSDILRHLPNCDLAYKYGQFVCSSYWEDGVDFSPVEKHLIASEACAALWLKLNSKEKS